MPKRLTHPFFVFPKGVGRDRLFNTLSDNIGISLSNCFQLSLSTRSSTMREASHLFAFQYAVLQNYTTKTNYSKFACTSYFLKFPAVKLYLLLIVASRSSSSYKPQSTDGHRFPPYTSSFFDKSFIKMKVRNKENKKNPISFKLRNKNMEP